MGKSRHPTGRAILGPSFPHRSTSLPRLHGFMDQLCQILYDNAALTAGGFQCILVHGEVLRAGDDKGLHTLDLHGFADPRLTRALPYLAFLHPHPPTAGAAAEGRLAIARHFDQFTTRRFDHPAGWIKYAVVAPQVARVVVRHSIAQLPSKP